MAAFHEAKPPPNQINIANIHRGSGAYPQIQIFHLLNRHITVNQSNINSTKYTEIYELASFHSVQYGKYLGNDVMTQGKSVMLTVF